MATTVFDWLLIMQTFHCCRFYTQIILLVSCVFVIPVFGQTESAWPASKCEKLKEYLVELNQQNQFNGTVLIAENGEVKFHESVGFSNFEEERKLDSEAAFRLASVSKQFTCMGIMLLKKDGKLKYDDPVVKHLPSFPYKNITIRQLMHHNSGMPDYMRLMGENWDSGKPTDKRKIARNKNMLDQFIQNQPKLVFQPGEKHEYSNSGYVVLGYLIETISKQPIQEFFQDRIFKPLGMANSHVFRGDDSFKPKHRVYGFRYTKEEPGFVANDYHYLNGMVGDGGIYASALDLLKWDQALYGNSLVSQEMLAEAFTSGKLNSGKETGYGFGWGIDKNEAGQLQVSHGGSWVGFITYIGRNISEQRTLIILTNHSSRHLGKVMGKISELAKTK